MRRLWEMLQPALTAGGAPADSHWGEALQMPHVWQELQSGFHSGDAPTSALGR